MGFSGHAFTWNNRRSGHANIQERLDRSYVNATWKLNFAQSTVIHLPAIHSDHKPLLINTMPTSDSPPKPFCFEAMWINHPDTSLAIEEAWNRSLSFASRLKNTKIALKQWNKTVFGNIHVKLKHLKLTIDSLQSQPQTSAVISLENSVQRDLDDLTRREEMFWREKAKARWIEEGDSNTHYFHLTPIIHRRHMIHNLMCDNLSWITDRTLIGEAFLTYFSNLFASSCPSLPPFLQDLIPEYITTPQNDMLTAVSASEEIHKALFSLGNYKSPGLDGLTVTF